MALVHAHTADTDGNLIYRSTVQNFNPVVATAGYRLVGAVIAFNLTRAGGAIAGGVMGKAATATIRRKIINVPARTAPSARRLTLHLPEAWPRETAWRHLLHANSEPPGAVTV